MVTERLGSDELPKVLCGLGHCDGGGRNLGAGRVEVLETDGRSYGRARGAEAID